MENILRKYGNNEIKLFNKHVYDVDNIKVLIKYNCKDRPIIKWLKSYNEKKIKQVLEYKKKIYKMMIKI